MAVGALSPYGLYKLGNWLLRGWRGAARAATVASNPVDQLDVPDCPFELIDRHARQSRNRNLALSINAAKSSA